MKKIKEAIRTWLTAQLVSLLDDNMPSILEEKIVERAAHLVVEKLDTDKIAGEAADKAVEDVDADDVNSAIAAQWHERNDISNSSVTASVATQYLEDCSIEEDDVASAAAEELANSIDATGLAGEARQKIGDALKRIGAEIING